MLDNWKKKPIHVRERIAYAATAGSLIVLVLFWVWTLNYRFTNESASTARANSFHPLSLLKDSLSGIYGDVKNGITGAATEYKNISSKNAVKENSDDSQATTETAPEDTNYNSADSVQITPQTP